MSVETNTEKKIIFSPTTALLDVPTHYCPGCTHGLVHRLIGEVIEELDILKYTIGVAPVGCSVLAYNYFACDMFEAAHGRAPAVATGIKRALPDKIVFTYQGDGDLAAIGTAEAVHAAARGEKIVTVFINNCIYGMTGGQMAPTSLAGQITETSPYGRDTATQGFPIRFSEMIAQLEGTHYVERVSVDTIAHLAKAKRAIKKAFQNAIDGKGYNLIEVLSICPTNWGLNPQEAFDWLRANMIPYYELGVKKDKDAPSEELGVKKDKDAPSEELDVKKDKDAPSEELDVKKDKDAPSEELDVKKDKDAPSEEAK